MGFSNKVIQQAIKEQMRTGRVPDLNRIKREQEEAERRGKLYCRWEKDKKLGLVYGVFMQDMYAHERKVHQFTNVSSVKANYINEKVSYFNRVHRNFLSSLTRNPSTTMIQKLQKDLDGMVLGNER